MIALISGTSKKMELVRSQDRKPKALQARKAPKIPLDKYNARREELAEAALVTLAELGYARTSLREIANNSEFTHGVLHYYFTDKVDLIACSVKHYKAKCVNRYDQVTSSAQSAEQLIDGFVAKLGETLRDEAGMHRLWYDLRAQALFENAFQKDVAQIDKSLEKMIWRIICRLAELRDATPAMTSSVLYALFDGLFQKALLRHLSGDRAAVADLKKEAKQVLENSVMST
jgi:AcrR family transcriptional regulator